MKPQGKLTRTLILLKPDAIERNLSGEIIKRFERKGLRLVAAEMRWIDGKLAQQHYAEHKHNTSHFTKMTEALTRGPLMAIVLEGNMAVESSRQLIGQQSPLFHSQIGTIRADLAIEEPFNLVHGSDSDSAATREITLWFGKEMVKANQPKPTKVEQKMVQPNQILPLVGAPKAPALPKKNKKLVPSEGADIIGPDFEQYKADLFQLVQESGLNLPAPGSKLPIYVNDLVFEELKK